MAGIFDLDDNLDFDLNEEEFIFSDDDFETNEYIKNEKKAIELISQIISCENRNVAISNRVKKIDNMLDFIQDEGRFAQFSVEHDGIVLDYSRQKMTPEVKVWIQKVV